MSVTIGIDLGNTSTKAATMETDGPKLIENNQASRLTPSIAYLGTDHQLHIGEVARQMRTRDPQNVIFWIKHLLGRDFNDPVLQPTIQRSPSRIVQSANGECDFLLRGERHSTIEITAALLKQVKDNAEAKLGEITQTVLSVPGSFGVRQRQALMEAAHKAGLEPIGLLSEATAALLANEVGQDLDAPRHVLVVDYGGSSFCTTILSTGAGVILEKGRACDAHLGGTSFDQSIVDWLADQVRIHYDLDLRSQPNAPELLFRLMDEAESAKIRLCRTKKSVPILVPAFTEVKNQWIDIECELEHEQFQQMIQGDVQRSLELIEAALDQADLRQDDIDTVLLVGGSSRVPLVEQSLQDRFGEKLVKSTYRQESVAQGAAIHAGWMWALAGDPLTNQDRQVVEPATPDHEGDTTVLNILEQISLPIGLQLEGDVFDVLMDEHTLYPMDEPVSRTFRTSAAGQGQFRLPLYEGFEAIASRNQYLGQVEFDLPPGLPAGSEVSVSFLMERDGLLSVSVHLPQYPNWEPDTQMQWKAEIPSDWHFKPQSNARQFPILEEIISNAELQLFQYTLVRQEGQAFIPADRLGQLESLANTLLEAIKNEDGSQTRQLSRQLENELDPYGLFVALGNWRVLAQDTQVAARVGWKLMTHLRQTLQEADKALQRQDVHGLRMAIQAAGLLGDRILHLNSDFSETGLMGSGGGRLSFRPSYGPKPNDLVNSRRSLNDEEKPKGKPVSIEKPQPGMEVPGAVDRVHFSITAPPRIKPGSSYVVDLWAHLEQQRQEVIRRAKEAAGGREIQVKTKGPLPVRRGTVLSVHLKIDGMQIDDPEDTIYWEGEIGNANFAVQVPVDAKSGIRLGRATVYADAAPIAKINFELEVSVQSAEARPLPVQERLYRSAFASYASEDRDDVLRCVQGMEKAAPFMQIFMDVHSLRSGQNWEQLLWARIPASDVFFLFWSNNAKQSAWVEKEWRCALNAKGLDFIDPVPLQPPDQAPPPPELASLHFNDWELAYRRNHPQ